MILLVSRNYKTNLVLNIVACVCGTTWTCTYGQWCGLRLSILGQDQSETKKSVLVLVLQVWCCVVKHGLVTFVVKMSLKHTTTVQVLFIVCLFCA